MYINEKFSDLKSYPLYHFTSFYNAAKILEENLLKKGIEDDVADGVSFTRNKNLLTLNDYTIRFKFDRAQLASKYKIIPYVDQGALILYGQGAGLDRDLTQADRRIEAEEIIKSDINNVKKYIISVDCSLECAENINKEYQETKEDKYLYLLDKINIL